MKININDTVEVTFTDHGLKIYTKYMTDYAVGTDLVIDDIKTKVLQIWEVIQIFGPHTYLGCKPWAVNNTIDLFDRQEL